MAETVAYKYTSNKDPFDGTSALYPDVTDKSRVLVQGGAPVELTEEEYSALSSRFNLRKADSADADNAQGEKEAAPSPSDEATGPALNNNAPAENRRAGK